MKAPSVAAMKPLPLIGSISASRQKNKTVPQPITLPAMPISIVLTAPPGSRPGIIAFAANPVSVPNPTQRSSSFKLLLMISMTSDSDTAGTCPGKTLWLYANRTNSRPQYRLRHIRPDASSMEPAFIHTQAFFAPDPAIPAGLSIVSTLTPPHRLRS